MDWCVLEVFRTCLQRKRLICMGDAPPWCQLVHKNVYPINHFLSFKIFFACACFALKLSICFSKIKEIVVVAAVPIKMNSVKDTDVFQVAINCEDGNL